MFSFGISDNDKCLERAIQALQQNDSGSINEFMLRGRNAANSIKNTQIQIPDGLHLLAPSPERGLELFPKVDNQDVIFKIIDQGKEEFDIIIVDLGSELNSHLTIGAFRRCTDMVTVLDGNPAVLNIFERRLSFLQRLKIPTINKAVAITNNLPPGVTPQIIQHSPAKNSSRIRLSKPL
jgi:cellulose biosynthesis protein BcsQ